MSRSKLDQKKALEIKAWRIAVDQCCEKGDRAEMKVLADCFASDGKNTSAFKDNKERLEVTFKLKSGEDLSLLQFIVQKSKDVRTAQLIGLLCNRYGANFVPIQIVRDVKNRIMAQNLATINRGVRQAEENTDKVRRMQERAKELITKGNSLNQVESGELKDLQLQLTKVSAITNRQRTRRTAASSTNPPATTPVVLERVSTNSPPKVGFFKAAWNKFTSFFTRRSARVIPAVSNTTPQDQDNVGNSGRPSAVLAASNVRSRNRVAPAPAVIPAASNTTPQDNVGNSDQTALNPSTLVTPFDDEMLEPGRGPAATSPEDNVSISSSDKAELKAFLANEDTLPGSGASSSLSKEEQKIVAAAAKTERDLAAVNKQSKQLIKKNEAVLQMLARPLPGAVTNDEAEAGLDALMAERPTSNKPSKTAPPLKLFLPDNKSNGSEI